MYTDPALGTVDRVLDLARARALRERARFAPFIDAGRAAALNLGLPIVGAGGIRHVLGDSAPAGTPAELADYDTVALLCGPGRARESAAAIATAVFRVDPGGLGRYTVAIDKPGAAAVVRVDGRVLFSVTATEGPLPRPAAGGAAPPGILLVEVLGALCDPARAADWPALVDVERRLRQLFLAESPFAEPTSGGRGRRGARRLAPPHSERRDASHRNASHREGKHHEGKHHNAPGIALANAVMLLASRPGVAVTGAAAAVAGLVALGVASGAPAIAADRPQLVAADAADIAAALVAAAARLGIVAIVGDAAPTHPRAPGLRRFTVYAARDAGMRGAPLADVFDAPRRELTPIWRLSGAKTEPQFVSIYNVMRLRLIDAWTVDALAARGFLSSAAARARGRAIITAVIALGAALDADQQVDQQADPDPSAAIFPQTPDDFVGVVDPAPINPVGRPGGRPRERPSSRPGIWSMYPGASAGKVEPDKQGEPDEQGKPDKQIEQGKPDKQIEQGEQSEQGEPI